MAVAPDMPGKVATACRAGQQAAEAVLAAVNRAPMPSAVPGAEPLNMLERGGIDEGAEGR
jgi:hypothetical protein